MADLPPLPPGFSLDAQGGGDLPPMPEGFSLDGAEKPREKAPINPISGAIGEPALQIASGLGHMIKGGWEGIKDVTTGQGTAKAASDIESEESKTYQPQSGAGKAVSGGLAAVGGALQRGAEWAGGKVQEGATALGASPEVAGAAGAAVDTAGQSLPIERLFRGAGAVGRALKATGKDLAIAKQGAQGGFEDIKLPGTDAPIAGEEKADLVKRTQALGLKLTPQFAGGKMGRAAAGFAGRPQLEREIAHENAEGVLKAAGADVGLKDVNKSSVAAKIKQELVRFQQPRTLGRVNLKDDAKFQSDMASAGDVTKLEEEDFPDSAKEDVAKEIKKYLRPSADSDSMTRKVAKLREEFRSNFRGNADDVALARVQKKIAQAFEDAIERHGESIGRGDVIKDFRESRVQLAKLYTLDEALTESGYLDLDVLRKDHEANPKMMTGNFKTLAQARSAFKPLFQVPDKIREHPVGALDIAMAVGGGATKLAGGDLRGLYGIAAGASRPLTRKYLRSQSYQKKLVAKPKAPTLEDIENPR